MAMPGEAPSPRYRSIMSHPAFLGLLGCTPGACARRVAIVRLFLPQRRRELWIRAAVLSALCVSGVSCGRAGTMTRPGYAAGGTDCRGACGPPHVCAGAFDDSTCTAVPRQTAFWRAERSGGHRVLSLSPRITLPRSAPRPLGLAPTQPANPGSQKTQCKNNCYRNQSGPLLPHQPPKQQRQAQRQQAL